MRPAPELPNTPRGWVFATIAALAGLVSGFLVLRFLVRAFP